MAGSAGTVITLAGHAAAMAPETAIGAASPVGGEGEDLGETMEAKTKNILKATVRSLAERRGPDALRLAEETIDTASAASSSEAHAIGLVDFIAEDLDDLLRQLDGFTVPTPFGEVTLHTEGAPVRRIQPSLIETVLNIATNPTIVFLLLIIGVQSILVEIASPGGWVAGFIGVVSLLLAGYGLGLLPVNWFGAIFLILAFVLFILEIKAATHGALTAAGIGSLIVGAMVLFNSPSVPSFTRVPFTVIISASLVSGAIFFVAMMFGVRAQKTPLRMGAESLVGRVGTVRSDLSPVGHVQLGGESWTAASAPGEAGIQTGDRVEVMEVRGLRLVVRRVRPAQSPDDGAS
jgi:membrane-bound serine protease (ClpP class)